MGLGQILIRPRCLYLWVSHNCKSWRQPRDFDNEKWKKIHLILTILERTTKLINQITTDTLITYEKNQEIVLTLSFWVFFKIDVFSCPENRGLLTEYCLSVEYLEAGGMVIILCGSPLSLPLSVSPLSQSFAVGLSGNLLLFCNSERYIFHHCKHPFTSIEK